MLETFIPRKKPSIRKVLGSLKDSMSEPLVKGGKSAADLWEQIDKQAAVGVNTATQPVRKLIKKNGV